MACRVTKIEVSRVADFYDVMITAHWMIDRNNRKEIEQVEELFCGKDLVSLNPRLVFDEVGEERPLPTVMERLKETLCNASQKERDEIYRWLHFTFQCRL